jgi:hypothetical protein
VCDVFILKSRWCSNFKQFPERKCLNFAVRLNEFTTVQCTDACIDVIMKVKCQIHTTVTHSVTCIAFTFTLVWQYTTTVGVTTHKECTMIFKHITTECTVADGPPFRQQSRSRDTQSHVPRGRFS